MGPENDAPRRFDVCILCALAEEAKAFMEIARKLGASKFHADFSSAGLQYYHAVINNHRQEPLGLQVSWQTGYGPLEAGLHMQRILGEFKPTFAGMTGICAGDRSRVALGDIIVAERAFFFDTGKFTRDKRGRSQQQRDTETRFPTPAVLHFVRGFEGWESGIPELQRPVSRRQQRDWLLTTLLEEATSSINKIGMTRLDEQAPAWRTIVQALLTAPDAYLKKDKTLQDPDRVRDLFYGVEVFPYKDPQAPRVYIAPMASSNAVRADRPFDNIRVPVRGTLAVDMEGAAFYRTAIDFPDTRFLLVKGVADYADNEKDDSYHAYASAVSAAYMLCLMKAYIRPIHHRRTLEESRQAGMEQALPAPIAGIPPVSVTPPSSAEADAIEPPENAINLFYAYAPEDEALRSGLETHLNILQRLGYVAESYGKYTAEVGIDEEQRMLLRLAQSRIILLLISPAFMNSERCNKQMEQALKMQAAGKARVVPILLRSTFLEGTAVDKLTMLPRNKKPVASRKERDTAFSEVVREIRTIITQLREKP